MSGRVESRSFELSYQLIQQFLHFLLSGRGLLLSVNTCLHNG